MLVALGTIAEQQAKGTEQTFDAITQLLNYATTHPNASIRYHASDMILHIDSDASYMLLPQARSCAGGYFYLSDKAGASTAAPTQAIKLNGTIHVASNKIKHVMASAAEAELGALFKNCQEVITIRNALEDMGHRQPPMPVKTDNATAVGITNNTMKQRKLQAMDMRFYWLCNRVNQSQFIIYWRPGSKNLADYFTKHHSTVHHRRMRSTYLTDTK